MDKEWLHCDGAPLVPKRHEKSWLIQSRLGEFAPNRLRHPCVRGSSLHRLAMLKYLPIIRSRAFTSETAATVDDNPALIPMQKTAYIPTRSIRTP